MIKILVIGNSFSENATFYLHQAALSAGIKTKVVNLNLGGCSFERHWQNISNEQAVYRYELNGYYDEESQKNPVTIQEVLFSEKWDYVVSQQASRDSGVSATYYPYALNIYAYLRQNIPHAKFCIQQTWAYEINSQNEAFFRYHKSQSEMYQKLSACYQKIAQELSLFVIPTGKAIQELRKMNMFHSTTGEVNLSWDGHHLSPVYGKFAASLVWLKFLLGVDVKQLNYVPLNRYNEGFIIDLVALEVIKSFVSEFTFTQGTLLTK